MHEPVPVPVPVVAGMMGIVWVAAIAGVVAGEKLSSRGERTGALDWRGPDRAGHMGAPVVSWQLNGNVLIACNCDWGCPCNFNAPPTHGDCEGGWIWSIDESEIDGIDVSGRAVALFFGGAVLGARN